MLCLLENRRYGALGKYGAEVLVLSCQYSSYQLCHPSGPLHHIHMMQAICSAQL